MEGVDCVVRKEAGGYLEIQVKTNNTPKDPRWWSVGYAPNRDDYIFVLIAVSLKWTTWIIPGASLHKFGLATGPTQAKKYNIDFGTRGRAAKAEMFKDNWESIVAPAEKEIVPVIPSNLQKRDDISTLA
jgi:hypothetical protein